MDVNEKKHFMRQMYTADSEVGKIKLQSVKENLYEATTKVVLYSIEMYTKMNLQEWVRTGLLKRFDKANNDLKRQRDKLEEGSIGMFDITNGCSVINDFVRNDALELSRKELQIKIELQKSRKAELEEKQAVVEKRKNELEEGRNEEKEPLEDENVRYFFNEDNEAAYNSSEGIEDEDQEEYDDDLEDDEEAENASLSQIELFTIQISLIKDLEELADLSEKLEEEEESIEELIKELEALTKKGKDNLTKLYDAERELLENLRTLRNTVFAHRSEDQQEISLIGSWEPEAGPLYNWASEILNYIGIIEKRYAVYTWFDDFYASKERKDKFDECKVYVQKQIRELYVNHSSVVFEFAGELYDKEDEKLNFKKLIEDMASSWDTGIRYLTVVTNEDLPELNIFFKECLSGTDKYVDYYLIDRNALRESCRKKDSDNVNYLYFKLLYHLNPAMEKIYWKDRAYTKKEFARQILHKLIKVKHMFQLDGRLKNFEKYIDGIDVRSWCEQHLLSEIYFNGMDDMEGKDLAFEMENAIIDFCSHNESKGRTLLYRRAIKASVKLYFYMGEDYVFSYTRSNGQTLHWHSLEDASRYMENANRFKSYAELSSFVDEMYKSDYFKIWRSQIKKKVDREV